MLVILTREEKRKVRRIIRGAVNTIKVVATIGVCVATFAICGHFENHYKIDAEITHKSGNTYTVVDVAGYEWEFETDEYMPVGTEVTMKMFNGHTHSIRVDDEIVKVTPNR